MNAPRRDEELLIAMRRIIRAIDLQSRALLKHHKLSGPQLLVLRTVRQLPSPTATDVARAVSLSQATMTGILKRLEGKGLIERAPDTEDRRKVRISVTDAGEAVISAAPRSLQETFVRQFADLPDWEQMQILSAFHRVVAMLEAEDIDASPVLTTDPIAPGGAGPDQADT